MNLNSGNFFPFLLDLCPLNLHSLVCLECLQTGSFCILSGFVCHYQNGELLCKLENTMCSTILEYIVLHVCARLPINACFHLPYYYWFNSVCLIHKLDTSKSTDMIVNFSCFIKFSLVYSEAMLFSLHYVII